MFNFEIKVSYPTINGKQLTHQFLDCKVSKGEAYTYKADEITNHSLKEVLALAFDTIQKMQETDLSLNDITYGK